MARGEQSGTFAPACVAACVLIGRGLTLLRLHFGRSLNDSDDSTGSGPDTNRNRYTCRRSHSGMVRGRRSTNAHGGPRTVVRPPPSSMTNLSSGCPMPAEAIGEAHTLAPASDDSEDWCR